MKSEVSVRDGIIIRGLRLPYKFGCDRKILRLIESGLSHRREKAGWRAMQTWDGGDGMVVISAAVRRTALGMLL